MRRRAMPISPEREAAAREFARWAGDERQWEKIAFTGAVDRRIANAAMNRLRDSFLKSIRIETIVRHFNNWAKRWVK